MEIFLQLFKGLIAASLLFFPILIWLYIKLLKQNKELKQNIAQKSKVDIGLRTNALRFRELFENTIGISVQGYNHKRQVIYWNDASQFLYGYTAEQAIGKQLEDLIIPDEIREPVIDGINIWINGGAAIPASELSLMKSDGSRIPVFSNHFLLRNLDNQVELYCVDIDLTELKRVEKQKQKLFESKQLAEAANQAKSQFLTNMSHELKTPLNAILGFSQLLQLDESINSTQLDSINEIYNAGIYLLELIDDILDLSKIESGRMEFSIEDVSLNKVMLESLNLITPLAEKRGISIITMSNGENLSSYDKISATITFQADHTRFKQAILNLLSNAVKYNKENGCITINFDTSIERQLLRISVTDTGKGLSAEQQAQLFQPFERLGAITSSIEGTGIGLLITKKIIQQMGGSIGVDNKSDQGCTFWVEFPYTKK